MAKGMSSGKNSKTMPKQSEATTQTVSREGIRQRMIAEAAYYRALQRNFDGGDPLTDWLEAEKEIDRRLRKSH